MSQDTLHAASRSDFATSGIATLPDLVVPEQANKMFQYLLQCARNPVAVQCRDAQVPNAVSFGNDPVFDRVLRQLTMRLSTAAGVGLLPTYSYCRLYGPGDALLPHVDRDECEISATVALGTLGGDTWPILIKDLQGATMSIDQRPGDALLYRGRERCHWRERKGEGYQGQLFLHYVDASGRFKNLGRSVLHGPEPDVQKAW